MEHHSKPLVLCTNLLSLYFDLGFMVSFFCTEVCELEKNQLGSQNKEDLHIFEHNELEGDSKVRSNGFDGG